MSNPSIPNAVLSEKIQDVINGRLVKVAVFLSFQFDPSFFEEEILPVLFSQSFSHIPKIRLLQMEEILRKVHHVAVYYDRSGLAADAQPAKLDYRRIGLSRSTGIFHPKNIFLLLENSRDGSIWESLMVITLSANLTRAGWWENVEVAHIEEVHPGKPCSFRDDLLDLIGQTKDADKTGLEHSGLETIQTFLNDQVDQASPQKRIRRWQPRIYAGQQSVPDFLQQFIAQGKFNLEIISPYFDDTDTAGALRKLLEALTPKETRLLLPEGKDGAALCREGYYKAVEQLGTTWSRLPAGPLQPPVVDKSGKTYRFVHAKVYRFWNQNQEIFFVGSVNLTQAAHQSSAGGNLETAILFESEKPTHLGWWLEPIGTAKPTEFRAEKSEDAALDETVGKLSIRYNWESGKLDYFWESGGGSSPRQAFISSQGVPLFTINSIEFDEWARLSNTQAKIIEDLLNSTSVVDVSADDGLVFRILIQEESMAHKPSIFLSLTAEEILRYWSLLSAEQREAFINDRAIELAIGTEFAVQLRRLDVEETMFDRFAGIFHAFGRLEHHIMQALKANRENEAIYRLFGKKQDSLPSLIDKVVQGTKTDPVNRYVTLLCARQLLQRIETNSSNFIKQHQVELNQVYIQLKAIDQIRADFTFDDESERQKFFDWFDEMFFLDLNQEVIT